MYTVVGWLCFLWAAKSIFAPYLYTLVIKKHVFLEEKTIFATSKFHEKLLTKNASMNEKNYRGFVKYQAISNWLIFEGRPI